MNQEKTHNKGGISKIPAMFFVVVTFILTYIAWVGTHSVVFHELSTISRYLAWSYGVIIFFDFLQKIIINKKESGKDGKNRKVQILPKKLINILVAKFSRSKKKIESEDIQKNIPTDDEKRSEDKGLRFIPKMALKAKHAEQKDMKAKDSRKMQILKLAYLLALGIITLNFVLYFFEHYLLGKAYEEFEYSLAHVALTAGIAIVSLVLKKWFESGKEPSRGNTTAVVFFAFYGGISAITAFFIALNVMLQINTIPIIFWITIISFIYFAFFFIFKVGISAIKRELLKNIDYHIYIPFLTKGNEQKLLDLLEESTGLSLKSLWSIKYVSTIFPAGILGLGLILVLASCIYTVSPYEQAVVYRLGEMRENSIKDSGVHFKAPWPIDKLEIYDTKRIKTMTIGYEAGNIKDYLWTEPHGTDEYTLLLGNGNDLVSINLKLMYSIDDLYSYVSRTADPQSILRAKAYEILMNKTTTTTLDNFLSVDRSNLSESIKTELENFCDESKIGLQVKEVAIESIHPPISIADTYQSVVSAGIKKTTMITNAQATALEIISKAEQRAETNLIDAQANRIEKVSAASYEMSVYKAAMEAYRSNPQSFKLHKYLTTYEKVINNNKVYVFFPNASFDMSDYIINHSNNSNITVIE